MKISGICRFNRVLPFLAAVSAVLTLSAAGPVFPLQEPNRTVFWLGNPNLGIFDRQTVEFIARHASGVVIRAPVKGPTPHYDYAEVIRRFHAQNPQLRVLVYGKVQMASPHSKSAENEILRGMGDLGEMLLPVKSKEGEIYGDIANPAYRRWLIDRIIAMIDRLGADGIAFDNHYRYPFERPKNLNRWVGKDAAKAESYGRGMDAFHRELKVRLGSRLLIFNSIWSHPDNPTVFPNQMKLLPLSDGTSIEYYGGEPNRGEHLSAQKVGDHIKPYREAMAAHPDRAILAYARGVWDYQDYAADYAWQRYLFGQYLLGAGPNTTYKYHSSFQIPAHAGRTGGLDLYADQLLPLGNPLTKISATGGVTSREFEHGLVAVADHGGKGGTFRVPRPMFSPEGNAVSGELALAPGTAAILLRAAPVPPAPTATDFDGPNPPGGDWERAEILADGGQHFLRVKALPEREWEHDLMLEPPVRRLTLRPQLSLRVRSSDRDARLLAVAEVDDSRRESFCVVVEVAARSSVRASASKGGAVDYRSARKGSVPYVQASPLEATGAWQAVRLDAGALLGPTGRFTFKRWSHMRLVGTMDLDDVRLTSPK